MLRLHKSIVPQEDEEFLALRARLYKDQYKMADTGQERARYATKSRDLYLKSFEITNGYYSAINAATLSLFIDDPVQAKKLAGKVLQLCDPDSEDYWQVASCLEASLVLNDLEGMEHLVAKAAALGDVASLSSTYQQLKLLCEKQHIPADFLADIAPASVIHYTGQMIHGIGSTPGIDANDVERVEHEVQQALQSRRVGFGFGSLACGADLIVADKLIELGAELHVVLPFDEAHFREISVAPAGELWTQRFDNALAQASSITHVVNDATGDYELLFHVTAVQAMGMAKLKAATLGNSPLQLALWNGIQTDSVAGTAADIRRWKKHEGSTQIIHIDAPRTAVAATGKGTTAAGTIVKHDLQALVFADFKGFSALQESDLPVFFEEMQGKITEALSRHPGDISLVNTWGDAVFAVVSSVEAAARLSLDISQLYASPNASSLPLDSNSGFRVSAHIGPVFYEYDRILEKNNYFGMHVNKAARMEPCTPVGSVYVTEAFAAHLAMNDDNKFVCEYAGVKELPKGFGMFRLYRLQEHVKVN